MQTNPKENSKDDALDAFYAKKKRRERLKSLALIAATVTVIAILAAIVENNNANSYTTNNTLSYYTCESQLPQSECADTWGTPGDNQLKATRPQTIATVSTIIAFISGLVAVGLFLESNE